MTLPFLLRVLAAACGLLTAGACLARDARPNVLLIITDDQGYGDFSVHGNPYVQTPHLDQLAHDSVQFDRFYVNSFCAPTRAALLTGRWPLRTGCHGVTHNREVMRSSEVTLAEALGGAGYRTACIGKWHNGEQYPYTPQGQGFHESFGFNNGHWNQYFDATLLRGAQPETTAGYVTDVLTDEALAFIRRQRAEPFFCYVAYNAPHSPYQVPDRCYDKFRSQGLDENVAAFYGMCENIDDNVGRLLAELEQLQLTDNTIVVFLTDNGGTAGVPLYNAGMRGGKTSLHEGGSRVPLWMRWPAAGWQPHVVTPIAAHIDLYPTLLDLCGVPTPPGPPRDGVSLRPLLADTAAGTAAWPERVLFTHNPIDEQNRYPGAVRTQRYRLVRELRGRNGGSAARAGDARAVPWQLYDMQQDPGQARDIAAEQPELVQQLSQQYEAWYDDVSAAGRRRLPLPVGYAEQNPVELQAPQAYFDPPLKFASGPGFANDWLTGWNDVAAGVWFEIEVAQAGDYEVELACACPAEDAGAQVRLTVGTLAVEAVVPSLPATEIPLPHRDAQGHARYRNRSWGTLPLGKLTLPSGPATLRLTAVSMPGSQVLELKHVRLTRLPAAKQAVVGRPPNILLAIADDWGVHAGAYGTRWVQTPAFDRVAREGLLFRHAYTPVAKCAPSRAILLTGRHAWQNREAGNHMAVFPPDLRSWPEVLAASGWHTGMTGKGWSPGIANAANGQPRLMTGTPYNRRKAAAPTTGIAGNDYAANFVDFLDAAPADAPWCFWCGALEPHRGYEFQSGVRKGGKQLGDVDRVPRYWPDDEIVRHDMLDYALEVEHVDRHLDRMLQELERRGQLDNTVVIVTSDHGMPFPRVKGYAYHDANRIPLAVRWPAGIRQPGRVIDDFVDFTDLAPTVLDLAGIAAADSGMQPITGSSWRPLLESAQEGRVLPQRDHVLIGKERTDVGRPLDQGYPIRGIVTADFLYLRNFEPGRWPAGNPETGYLDTDGSPTKTLILERGRTDRADRYWQLNFGLRPAEELYALSADPDCVVNLAAEARYAADLQRLRQRMEAELRAQQDPRMFGQGHVFDQYRPTSGAGFYEQYLRGEKPKAGWVNPGDFEPTPLVVTPGDPASSKQPQQ